MHAKFVKIHPFVDGNGRTGRLLLNLELLKAGYPPAIILKEDRLAYYDALDEACVSENYEAIIYLVANAVERSLDAYLDLLRPAIAEEMEDRAEDEEQRPSHGVC